jgi:putative membrane protein
MNYSYLPALNAFLNGTSAVLLTMAFIFIRKKNIAAHKRCMLAAVICSILFLTSYLIYHAHAGATRFVNPAWFRKIYIPLLISHTILAATIVPLIIITLTRAFRERFDKHRKIARWTWPIWMYVSVTGVMIYFILYWIYPQPNSAQEKAAHSDGSRTALSAQEASEESRDVVR